MSLYEEFKLNFSSDKLRDIYNDSIKFKGSIGIDRINVKTFEKVIDTTISAINKKVLEGRYKFTPYREKLIIRGADKKPRKISIPTLRDKLTLKALSKTLSYIYSERIYSLHETVIGVAKTVKDNNYDSFIRFDIQDFYPSIKQDILISILKRRVRNKEIIKLVQGALSKPTISKAKKVLSEEENGVQQGLPISNILANLYMIDVDKRFNSWKTIKYYRYVDDILIFCNKNRLKTITKRITLKCEDINLNIHEKGSEKNSSGYISDGFTYLGYSFERSIISVKKASIDKLRESIIKSFTIYKYQKSRKENALDALVWHVNLRITGCIFQKMKYGWLIYFSQINDMQLLCALDNFICKMLERFEIDKNKVKIKKFIRSYYQIKYNINKTKYMPNYDLYEENERRDILRKIFNVNVNNKKSEEIDFLFEKRVFKSIRELERDLSHTS